ncbi:MAG: leucine-rich repeat protein [Clostridiales bacterium]|nr:leucine-rich repeat protein [Clostridiales bacterium]
MRKRILKLWWAALALAFLFVLNPTEILAAETTADVSFTVKYGQSDARAMLTGINEFRTGSEAWYWNSSDTEKVYVSELEELVYDYDLEAIAQQRAVEIAISFSHTRPNGTSCFTLTNDNHSSAENIAVGYSTYSGVLEAWKETNEDYSGQGHRRNMLGQSYTCIGIGHVYYNGYHFWVQEFGTSATNTVATTANNSTGTGTVEILLSNLTTLSVSASDCEVSYNSTAALPNVTINIATANTWNGPCSVSTDYEWSADNEYISIQNGKIYGLKVGTGILTTTVLGKTVTASVNVNYVSSDGLTYKVSGSGKTIITKANTKAKSVTIPSTIKINSKTYKVISIADNAFSGNNTLTKVIIGKNVTSIGTKAFANCKKLKTVTFKTSKLKTIGKQAFKGDKKLTKITLKSNKITKNSVKNALKGSSIKTIKTSKKLKAKYKKIFTKTNCGIKVTVK